MTQETLKTVDKLMRDKGYVATFEYPNSVHVPMGGGAWAPWTAVLGGVNEFIGFDIVEPDSDAQSDLIGSRKPSDIPSRSEDADSIAEWFSGMLLGMEEFGDDYEPGR